ncbi:MAG: aldehyde dehydrogenase EutE [Chloroflexi bacterium]|nr:MAG: aldehyde dehydrogenase EutE [Phototrophicales bacterium]RMF80497.1 MAG: aldehyde dehydrogenase EutE [Chloroflexota bacterium]
MDENQIDRIIQNVMRELGGDTIDATYHHAPYEPPVVGSGDGIFPDPDSAIDAATAAFEILQTMPLDRRKEIIASMRAAAREHAQVLAQFAHEETGMGRAEDKVLKNLLTANKTPGPEFLDTSAWTGDGGLTLTEYAPYGVIGSITPSTNPTSTVINNSISMISAGNAVVFNAHPGARECSNYTVQLLNRAIQHAGGPPNLLASVVEPTIESAQALMTHKKIRLLAVTGGIGVVRAAMQSGKRAVCAGPGNPPVVVDETADTEQAGRDIVLGGSFDNNLVCTTEKTTFVVESVLDDVVDSMTRHGAYLITSWQLRRLLKSILIEDRGPGTYSVMNKEFIGQNANVLLREIGVNVGDEVRQIVAVVEPDHQLVWSEQMMPIMPVVAMPDVWSAIDLAVDSEHGFRHTAVMHSKNIDHMTAMARAMDCSIFVKNGPNLAGLGWSGEGFTSFTIASPTGEGMTTCRSFSRIRRCTLKDGFRIV